MTENKKFPVQVYLNDKAPYSKGEFSRMKNLKEAYFSKDAYERKAQYAYRISNEGITKLATWIVCRNNKINYEEVEQYWEDLEEKSWENDTYDEFKQKLEEFEEEIEDISEELIPISELSHARHKMHTSTPFDFDCFDEIGHQYSDICLVSSVNDIIKEYKLPLKYLDTAIIPEITTDDNIEDIAEYYDLEIDEDEIEDDTIDTDFYYEYVYEDWDKVKDDYSEYIRDWFGELNDLVDSDFPS